MAASSPSLSAEEVLAWNDLTATNWHALLDARPEVLTLPCDIYGVSTVAGVLHHIVVVELRYAERLAGLRETAYEDVGCATAAELFATHDRATEIYRGELASGRDWEEIIAFQTKRWPQPIQVSRKTVLFHAMLHSIRHYAQLATLVRQHGVHPSWPMDYLFMGMNPPGESN